MAQLSEHLKVCEDSDWYLLRSLWRLEVELGRSPTKKDFPRGDCPDLDEYYLAFGKLRFARTAAGLATDRNQGIEAQKANLILDLIELGERLGRTPSATDLNEAARKNECRYAGAYLRAFGSL